MRSVQPPQCDATLGMAADRYLSVKPFWYWVAAEFERGLSLLILIEDRKSRETLVTRKRTTETTAERSEPYTVGMLCKLFVEHVGYVSDKWEHYLPIYESLFAGFIARGQPVRVLEIGVQNGGSLQIWSKYFPAGSTVVGIDIHPACASLAVEPNISIRIGDASSPSALDCMLGEANFDIIIDDGSHRSDQVVSTFWACFERLSPGGFYVIEDLHCSYWKSHGGGFRLAGSAIEQFKNLVDALNVDYFESDEAARLDSADLERLQQLGSKVARVSFFDSLIVVERLITEKLESYRRVITGREAHVVNTVVDIVSPITADPHAIRKLLLPHEAANTFTPALLEPLASATEALGQSRIQLAQRDKEGEQLRAEVARQSREAEALRAEVARQSREAEALRAEVARIAVLEGAVDQAEKLIAYTSERYAGAVRKRRIKALQRRIRLALYKSPVRRKLYERIGNSVLFDRHFYLNSNPDVRNARVDPIVHYIRFGASEGRDPSPFFSESGYRERYPDVDVAGLSAIEHYESHGRAEGRRLLSAHHRTRKIPLSIRLANKLPGHSTDFAESRSTINASALVDAEWYLKRYPDVADAGADPAAHFARWGISEGRQPNPFFDRVFYTNRHADDAAAQDDPIGHYLAHGHEAGFDPNPFFDNGWYAARHDLEGRSALEHFVLEGETAGEFPHPLWDEARYLGINRDVDPSEKSGNFRSGYRHFVMRGAAELEAGKYRRYQFRWGDRMLDYDQVAYLADNPDVGAAITQGRFRSGLEHWFAVGFREALDGLRAIYGRRHELKLLRDLSGQAAGGGKHLCLFSHNDRDPRRLLRD
jgi:hypothetical protein